MSTATARGPSRQRSAISRNAVKTVLRSTTTAVPDLTRSEMGAPHHDEILALLQLRKRNLVRVHEELAAKGQRSPTRR